MASIKLRTSFILLHSLVPAADTEVVLLLGSLAESRGG